MNREASVWIDRRQAVIELITDAGEEIKRIISNFEKYGWFSNGLSEDDSRGTIRDGQFGDRLDSYYDEIIALICDSESIQIFGLDEAKAELEKRLENGSINGCI